MHLQYAGDFKSHPNHWASNAQGVSKCKVRAAETTEQFVAEVVLFRRTIDYSIRYINSGNKLPVEIFCRPRRF